MDLKENLRKLCDMRGPSGFEEKVAKAAVEMMKPYVTESYIDKFGNAVGVLRSERKNAKKLLFDAHLDEVGFIVTGHDKGFLRFESLGGTDPRMYPGRSLMLLTDPPIPAVISCLPPHVLKKEDMKKPFDPGKLRIDAGLPESKAEDLVPIGTPASYDVKGFELGDGLWCGKSLDDRACFIAIVNAISMLKPSDIDVDIYVLGSLREEEHMSGAVTGAFSIAPDFAVAVDVTHAKTPDGGMVNTDCELGKGPMIAFGPNFSRPMGKAMRKICEERRIPYQTEVMEGFSGTNTWAIQISREGVASQLAELPLRYMHTPYEVISLEDMKLLSELLAEYAKSLKSDEEPGFGALNGSSVKKTGKGERPLGR